MGVDTDKSGCMESRSGFQLVNSVFSVKWEVRGKSRV